MLTPQVKHRAGALLPAAERFVSERMRSARARYRTASEGLVALCRTLERFAYEADVDPEAERRFIEGAGALLGVLLIDHLPNAAYAVDGDAHRVRLGEYGFFDPFAAVDRALDADDIRRELAREVALAEAEAETRGPLSRLVAALSQRLAHERPDFTIVEQFEYVLKLKHPAHAEPVELDVRRAVDATRDQDERGVERAIVRLVSLLPGASTQAEPDFAALRSRLVPRLVRVDALRDLSASAKSGLFLKHLVAELAIAVLIEYEGRARYLRADELDRAKVAPEDALALALENLRSRSQATRVVREVHGDARWLTARTGDGRDSARLLLPELRAALIARLGAAVCVAIPHRDTFFACSGSCDVSRRHVAERAREDAARAPHALSASLLWLHADGLTPLSHL